MNELSPSPLTVLHFTLNNIYVCIDLKRINKVLLLPQLEPVPSSPPYLAGLLNFAGQSIPVIDLALRLDLTRKNKYTLETPILLCENNNNQVGLIVDKILGFSTVESAELQLTKEFNVPDSPFIAAVAFEKKLSLLINVANILAIEYSLNKSKINLNNDLIKLAKTNE